MGTPSYAAALLVLGLGAGCAVAAEPARTPGAAQPAPEAAIHFADHGSIWNWRADRTRGLWVQDARKQWYYAKFLSACIDLPFAEGVAFVTSPGGTFDRWSSVVVPRHERCTITSFVTSAGPPARRSAAAVPESPAVPAS